jgi:uncharacterized membrane protein
METEQNVYSGVYRVLLVGMTVSTVLYAAGIIRALLNHQYVPLSSAWVRTHYHWSFVFHGLWRLDPTALLMVATIILILTPVARVLVSIHAFYVDGDRKYVAVTGIVFLVIALTVVLGWLGLK